MKYYLTLSAREADGTIREVVIEQTTSKKKALEGCRNLDAALPKTMPFGDCPVCFVLDEAGAIIDR